MRAASPRQSTANTRYVGVVYAVVTQNKDPEGQHRVRVKFPWHDNSQESYWARIAVPMAGKDRGMAFLPEVGDEVLVAFALTT